MLYVGSSGADAPERVQQVDFYVLQRYSAALLWWRVVCAHIELMLIIESGWKSRLLLLHRAVRWVERCWGAREAAAERMEVARSWVDCERAML